MFFSCFRNPGHLWEGTDGVQPPMGTTKMVFVHLCAQGCREGGGSSLFELIQ